MKAVVIFLHLMPPGVAPSGPGTREPITPSQAVAVAERFVRDNGNTEFRPTELAGVVPESIEWDDRATAPELRHNTLRPRAKGYLAGARNDPKGWTVGFERVTPADPAKTRPTGRAVTMDRQGRNVRMQHVDFFLDHLQPRPE